MRYIGITGHRGSGKTSVAYLLGNMLDLLKYGRTKEQLRSYYWEWCETIENCQNAIYDCALNYVYFDEFGEMPKSFVAQLLGIDMAVLDNDTLKDNMYVSMKDFKLHPNSDTLKIITAEDILTSTGKKWSNCYISLREFTKCLSIDIMQKFFGSDVWLKTLKVNDEKWTEPEAGWRLFSDVKTKDEIQYIRDKQGVLIRTTRDSKKKRNKGITNIENCNPDYVIDTSGKLIDLFDSIYEIAEKIYNDERVF